MSDYSDPVVRCQRCNEYGARVVYGWALLCARCRAEDDAELCTDCGHGIRLHGDRAVIACQVARCGCRGFAARV